MFFIGIFGINRTQKQIGTYSNALCPSCGATAEFSILKNYSYFHIFFIPTFRWNIKYYVKPDCCGTIYELDPDIGKEYERGRSPVIEKGHLRQVSRTIPYKECYGCGATVGPDYTYCPYCGKKLY